MISSRFEKGYLQILLLFLLFLTISCSKKETPSIRIATAANMQFAMNELVSSFTENTRVNCEIIVSSSGKLTAQIKEGAPYDLFVSADMKYPIELFDSSYTVDEPKIYAKGKLVLWTFFENLNPSIDILSSSDTKHIAIANPKTAPYGRAALEVLKKNNLLSKIEQKLVYGESVAQTNQFITTKAAEFGFTSKSVVSSKKMNDIGHWIEIDPTTYKPIFQGVVILKNHVSNIDHIQQFYNYLFSDDGKNILNKFGYSTNL